MNQSIVGARMFSNFFAESFDWEAKGNHHHLSIKPTCGLTPLYGANKK